MADKVVPGPVEGSAAVREAVCIHTRKIFDSCRDKDCVEDLRVYPDGLLAGEAGLRPECAPAQRRAVVR